MYLDYSGLLDKLNEVAFVPQKVKYQFDELKADLLGQVSTVKNLLESKLKEVDTYIYTFQHDIQQLQDYKKKERSDHILEMASIVKKVEEVGFAKAEMTKNINQIATMVACMAENEALKMSFQQEKEAKVMAQLKEMRALVMD